MNAILWVIGGIFIPLFLLFIADCSMAETRTISCACYGNSHESAHTYTTTSVGVKGQVSIGTASEPEKWQAIVDMDGQATAIACDRAVWPFALNGTTVEVTYRQGRMMTYFPRVTAVLTVKP